MLKVAVGRGVGASQRQGGQGRDFASTTLAIDGNVDTTLLLTG
jgi:hypothetical protein